MKKKILFMLLVVSGMAFSQERGKVFPKTPQNPTEDPQQNGVIVVTKNLYGLHFQDNDIPQIYKKAVELFFKQSFSGYSSMKTYELKVAKKYGFIYIEDKKILEIDKATKKN